MKKILFLILITNMISSMEEQKHSHTVMTHSTHDIRGTITETKKERPRSYIVDIHKEEKEEHESQESDTKYTSRFVILTNAGTAIITAGLSAGVAVAIALNTCGK